MVEKMRVAMLLPSLEKKGPVIVALNLAGQLRKSGIEVKIFYLRKSEEPIATDLDVERVTFGKVASFRDYDVVHSHSLRPDLVLALYSFFKPRRQKLVSTIHNIVYKDLLFDYGRVVAAVFTCVWIFAWSRLDLKISLSNFARTYYQRFRLKTVVINNGIPIPQLKQVTSHRKDEPDTIRLVSTSSLSKRKNIGVILRCLALDKRLKLTLVGEGAERENLMLLANDVGVAERVQMVGFQEDIYDYLVNSDIFVLSSYSEGHPLGLVEAASVGLPSVISNIPETKEFFSDNAIKRFDPDNERELLCAILACLGQYSMLSTAIKTVFHRKYTAEKMAQNYEHVYRTLAGFENE